MTTKKSVSVKTVEVATMLAGNKGQSGKVEKTLNVEYLKARLATMASQSAKIASKLEIARKREQLGKLFDSNPDLELAFGAYEIAGARVVSLEKTATHKPSEKSMATTRSTIEKVELHIAKLSRKLTNLQAIISCDNRHDAMSGMIGDATKAKVTCGAELKKAAKNAGVSIDELSS